MLRLALQDYRNTSYRQHDVYSKSATPFESQTTLAPAPNARTTNGVSPTTFWTFAGAVVFVAGLVGAIFMWRRYRRRARRPVARENATGPRTLSHDVTPSAPLETPVSPPRIQAPAVHNTSQPTPQQQEQANPTPPPAIHAYPDRSAQRDSVLREKMRRAHQRRLNALRETTLKSGVERGLRAAAPSEEDIEEEVAKKINENPYALDDTISRSDDSQFDLIRRGPSVNPEYQARRNERYLQKIAEGYTHEQAMSVSEVSTDDIDDPGPLAPRQPPNPSSIPRAANLPSSQQPPQPKPQLAPATVPERWQSREPEDILLPSTTYNPKDTPKKSQEQPSKEEETCLRLPHPNFSRPTGDPSRSNQARAAWTETTTDEVSTVISDDPWREEVRENRRLGR